MPKCKSSHQVLLKPGDRVLPALKIAHVGFYGQWQNASLPLWKDEGDGAIHDTALRLR